MVDKIKTAIKEATTNPFTPTASSGGVSVNLLVCLGADASAYANAPRQVQLVLNYLHDLGGQATIQQLNEFSVKAEGIQFWGYSNGDAYDQKPSKIMAHYFAKMTGDIEWSSKKGKLELVRLVK